MENNEEPSTDRFVIAFDFESTGGVPSRHKFTELGACLYNLTRKKVEKRFYMAAKAEGPDGGISIEKRCWTEFWSKNQPRFLDMIDNMVKSTVTCEQIIAAYVEWVSEIEKKRPDVYFITDCGTYDIGELKSHCLKDIMYLLGGNRRDIVDVSMFYYGMTMNRPSLELFDMSSKECALKAINKKRDNHGLSPLEMPKFEIEHNHNPVCDSISIALFWDFVSDNLEKLERMDEQLKRAREKLVKESGLLFEEHAAKRVKASLVCNTKEEEEE